MANTDINNRFRILHLEVSHGSDQYEIHFRMDRPPLVKDLMEELEKKTLVTTMNQQIFYRGQHLHETPYQKLENFGIFNGNRIVLVGEKLMGTENERCRHLLNIEKDVKATDDLLELICREFETLKHSLQPRSLCEHILHDLQTRAERCRSDLKAFQSLANNIDVAPSESDAYTKKNEVNALIRDRIDISYNVIFAISSYQGGYTESRLPTNDQFLFHKH